MFKSLFRVLKITFLKATSGFNAMGTVLILIIGVLILFDVIGRIFFNHPVTGVVEIVKVSIVGAVWIQIPYSTMTKLHVRSTLIHTRLGPNGKEVLNIISNAIGGSLMMILFWASWSDMIHSWSISEFEGEGVFRIPAYPIRTALTIGCGMAGIHFAALLIQNVLRLFRRQKEA